MVTARHYTPSHRFTFQKLRPKRCSTQPQELQERWDNTAKCGDWTIQRTPNSGNGKSRQQGVQGQGIKSQNTQGGDMRLENICTYNYKSTKIAQSGRHADALDTALGTAALAACAGPQPGPPQLPQSGEPVLPAAPAQCFQSPSNRCASGFMQFSLARQFNTWGGGELQLAALVGGKQCRCLLPRGEAAGCEC